MVSSIYFGYECDWLITLVYYVNLGIELTIYLRLCEVLKVDKVLRVLKFKRSRLNLNVLKL